MQGRSVTASTVLALCAVFLAAVALVSPALAGRDRTAGSGGTAGAYLAASSDSPAPAINVHGEGTVTLVPDMATVVLGVDARSSSAKSAQAAASTAMNGVVAAVRKHGIAAADMATLSVSLGPVYDYSGNSPRLTGYQASQSLQVKVRNLGDTGSLIDDAVAAGATQVQGVSLSVADPSAATAQARAAAVADAKAKADALAKAAGVTLGSPLSITETSSPGPIPLPYAAAAPLQDKSATQVVPGTFDVTVDVDVSYAIE